MNSEDQGGSLTNSREKEQVTSKRKIIRVICSILSQETVDKFIYITERKGLQAKLFTYQGETKIR